MPDATFGSGKGASLAFLTGLTETDKLVRINVFWPARIAGSATEHRILFGNDFRWRTVVAVELLALQNRSIAAPWESTGGSIVAC